MSHRLPLLFLAILPLVGGCGTARAYRARATTAWNRASTFTSASAPGPIAAEVLDRNAIASPIRLVNPGTAADRLVSTGAAANDPDGMIALAVLRTKQARRAEAFAPADAPRLYLDAVEAAIAGLRRVPAAGDLSPGPEIRELEARRAYNDAVAGFLRNTAGEQVLLDAAWRERLAAQGVTVRHAQGPASWDAKVFDHFYFAGDYRVYGINNPVSQDGLGVPMIAERGAIPDEQPLIGEDKFFPRRNRINPATVVLGVDRSTDGLRSITLDLIDPMRSDAVDFAGSARPLAFDLTTPLTFYFTSLPLPQITQIGLIRPGALEKQTGLYMLHPYEPGKIPVVLVHGLWSSPDAWHQALNDLRGDPELRARYQFWVFFYPTGDPFIYSATKLRESLAEIRATLDPQHADPAFDQMVLVGHSMGGLLTRLMVVDSGTTFWDAIANQPFEQLKAGPQQREIIEKTFFFEANRSIRRVIFIATPHRGSTLSGALVGRLGNALIRLPGLFEDLQRDLIAKNDSGFFKNNRAARPSTSITQLSPTSGALIALNDRRFAPGVTYHSIIAKYGSGPLETSSDLVVTYSSSHVEDAASEMIVPGTHACLGHKETIDEIRRILKLHLVESCETAPSK